MKFYSDELKKLYETQEECEQAEKEAIEARRKAEEEKEKLAQERKARAAEVEEARKAMIDAQKTYEDILSKFLRDYKTYHYSTSDVDDITRFFNFLW